jgi:hypothetical protein
LDQREVNAEEAHLVANEMLGRSKFFVVTTLSQEGKIERVISFSDSTMEAKLAFLFSIINQISAHAFRMLTLGGN